MQSSPSTSSSSSAQRRARSRGVAVRLTLVAALATLTTGCAGLFNNAPTLHALERAPQPQLERVGALPPELPVRISAALDPQTLGTLDRLCAQYNTSRSALIRAAIEVLK